MLAKSCPSVDIDFMPILGRRQHEKRLSSGGRRRKSLPHYEEGWRENELPSEGNIHRKLNVSKHLLW